MAVIVQMFLHGRVCSQYLSHGHCQAAGIAETIVDLKRYTGKTVR